MWQRPVRFPVPGYSQFGAGILAQLGPQRGSRPERAGIHRTVFQAVIQRLQRFGRTFQFQQGLCPQAVGAGVVWTQPEDDPAGMHGSDKVFLLEQQPTTREMVFRQDQDGSARLQPDGIIQICQRRLLILTQQVDAGPRPVQGTQTWFQANAMVELIKGILSFPVFQLSLGQVEVALVLVWPESDGLLQIGLGKIEAALTDAR